MCFWHLYSGSCSHRSWNVLRSDASFNGFTAWWKTSENLRCRLQNSGKQNGMVLLPVIVTCYCYLLSSLLLPVIVCIKKTCKWGLRSRVHIVTMIHMPRVHVVLEIPYPHWFSRIFNFMNMTCQHFVGINFLDFTEKWTRVNRVLFGSLKGIE